MKAHKLWAWAAIFCVVMAMLSGYSRRKPGSPKVTVD